MTPDVTSERRPVWHLGALVKIPLGDSFHTYGLLRKEPLISVLDARTDHDLDTHRLVERPVLFSVWVSSRALVAWPRVGVVELPASMNRAEAFVKRDRVSGRVTTYEDGLERPARRDEVEGLEVAAVWDPAHVVDRVLDHYNGRPNKWAQSLRNSVLTGDGRVQGA